MYVSASYNTYERGQEHELTLQGDMVIPGRSICHGSVLIRNRVFAATRLYSISVVCAALVVVGSSLARHGRHCGPKLRMRVHGVKEVKP